MRGPRPDITFRFQCPRFKLWLPICTFSEFNVQRTPASLACHLCVTLLLRNLVHDHTQHQSSSAGKESCFTRSDALCVALSGIVPFALVTTQHRPVEIKNNWSILSSLVELRAGVSVDTEITDSMGAVN